MDCILHASLRRSPGISTPPWIPWERLANRASEAVKSKKDSQMTFYSSGSFFFLTGCSRSPGHRSPSSRDAKMLDAPRHKSRRNSQAALIRGLHQRHSDLVDVNSYLVKVHWSICSLEPDVNHAKGRYVLAVIGEDLVEPPVVLKIELPPYVDIDFFACWLDVEPQRSPFVAAGRCPASPTASWKIAIEHTFCLPPAAGGSSRRRQPAAVFHDGKCAVVNCSGSFTHNVTQLTVVAKRITLLSCLV